MLKKRTFIDLFCGIGGFRIGMEKNGFQCVWACDIDKYACMIYRKHCGKEGLYEGDIREVPTEAIPNHDVLCAGFPCQSFSIAGKRLGFKDTRGTLFFEICRIAKEKQPPVLFLENVKGLLNHEKGETFRIILSSLDELGYDAEWQVLNSKDFGVPQNRERVFIIGHLRRKPFTPIFPFQEGNSISYQKNEKASGRSEIVTAITNDYHKVPLNRGETYIIYDKHQVRELTKNQPRGYRVYDSNGLSVTLVGRGGGIGAKTGLYAINGRIRRLTPLECERLQGFPDEWTKQGITKDGRIVDISDTQRYKCLGNAITVNVVEAIAREIRKIIFAREHNEVA